MKSRATMANKKQMVKYIEAMRRNLASNGKICKWKEIKNAL